MDNSILLQNLILLRNKKQQAEEAAAARLHQGQQAVQEGPTAVEGFAPGGLLHQYFQQQQEEQERQCQEQSSSIPAHLSSPLLEAAGFGASMLNPSYPLGSASPNASVQNIGLSTIGNNLSQQKAQETASVAKNDTWLGNVSGEGDPYAENGILGPWSSFSAGLLGNMALGSQEQGKKMKKRAKNRPKRPLSAYNIFFKEERNRILEDIPDSGGQGAEEAGSTVGGRKRKNRPHGKIGFESLAKMVGKRWKGLPQDQVLVYKKKAETDTARYRKEMEAYVANENKKLEAEQEQESEMTFEHVWAPTRPH